MKRRTCPAPSRPLRSVRPSSGLEAYFPGIDSLSDVDGFKMLCQMCMLSSPEDADLAYRFANVFTESRGLELHQTGRGFRGYEVYLLLKGSEVISSFSFAVER